MALWPEYASHAAMAQKKTNEVEAWLKRPDPAVRLVLIYGPDRGLVAERALAFIKVSGLDAEDPFSSVRLDAAELEADPGRLIDEASTVPMFAGRRLVWVRNAGAQKSLAESVKTLAAAPPADAIIIVEAGDLKKGTVLRTAVEASPHAMALPCYSDDGRSVDTVIDDVLGQAGLTIGLEARQLLRANLGGDRLATRSELDKLCTYCLGAAKITPEDVMLMTGDVAATGIDDAVDAVLEGNVPRFDRAFSRLVSSGTNPFLILAAASRQLQILLALRSEMDSGGKSAATAVASARPPVFFSRRRLVETALQRLGQPLLLRGLDRLQSAVLQTRRRPDLAGAAARQALLAVAVEAGRSAR